MRLILGLCGLILIGAIAWFFLSSGTDKHYGAKFSGAPRAEVEALISRPAEFVGKPLTIEGKVEDQCPATGCFFYFAAANGRLKVELGDLAQKLPRKEGMRAVVEGRLIPYGEAYQFLGAAVEFQ